MINAMDSQVDKERQRIYSNHIKDFRQIKKNLLLIQMEFINQRLQNSCKVIFHKEIYKKKATKAKDLCLKKINFILFCKILT